MKTKQNSSTTVPSTVIVMKTFCTPTLSIHGESAKTKMVDSKFLVNVTATSESPTICTS